MNDRRDRFDEWLTGEGARQSTLPTLIDSFCRFLNREGYQIRRCNLASETVHPLMKNSRHVWFDRAVELTPINPAVVVARRQYAIGEALIDEVHLNASSQHNQQYLASPFHQIELHGEVWEAIRPAGEKQPYPVFDDLAAAGCTGYFGLGLTSFPGMSQKIGFATTMDGGFDDSHAAELRRFIRLVTLHVDSIVEHEVKETLARVYVGQDPGRRVLSGMINLGEIVSLDAAIWFSDIRGFTEISDGMGAEQLVDGLNQYLEAVVAAIYGAGGEVLKYIGDAVLALFTVEAFGDRQRACAAALAAVEDSAARLAELNRTRVAGGEPAFAHGVGLHVGEVCYGNIGSRERLDFTVIGREVNIASRIEGMCKQLEAPLLCSLAFATESGRAFRDLGQFELKGVGEPIRLGVPG